VGTFEPQIVRKPRRRRTGVDQMVLPLYAKGPDHKGYQRTPAGDSESAALVGLGSDLGRLACFVRTFVSL
jgi:hypothetical protein